MFTFCKYGSVQSTGADPINVCVLKGYVQPGKAIKFGGVHTPTPAPDTEDDNKPKYTPTPAPDTTEDNTPTTDTALQQEAYAMLDATNKYRAGLGLPALKWNATLAGYAQTNASTNAENNTFDHTSSSSRQYMNAPYGQNLAASTGYPLSGEGLRAVGSWYDEKKAWDASKTPGNSTGHYTQLMWKATTDVGCALAQKGNRIVSTCDYFPSGNYKGEFTKNVPPF